METFAIFVYSKTKYDRYNVLAQNKALSIEELTERARAAGDTAFEKTIEAETTASIKVDDAIRMTMLFLQTNEESFMKKRSKLVNLICSTRRMEMVDCAMRFFEDHTQIKETKSSPQNCKLYQALHTVHFPENSKIDDCVASFTTNNQLVQHFERTRSKEHFLLVGAQLRTALQTILEWVKERQKKSI